MASNITGVNAFTTIGTQTLSSNSPPPSMASYSYNASSTEPNGACVEEVKGIERPGGNLNEKFVAVLDQLDARVEKYRKEAMALQEKREFLLMSIDLIKSNDLISCMSEAEREEIFTYLSRVNGRLSTVELHVKTIRDKSQEESLGKINFYIDTMITMGDPVLSRQRCQEYLNACCSTAESASECDAFEPERDPGPIDKRFENSLLGCTLDDQKIIKKRLQALLNYLNKRTIHN